MSTIILENVNLTKDPELRYSNSQEATPYVRLRVAENGRIRVNGEWTDAPTKFHNVTVFGAQAENVAESLKKGSTVHIFGELRTSQYEVEGQERIDDYIAARFVAPSLRYGKTTFEQVARKNTQATAQDDAWSTGEDVPPAE